MGKTQAAEVKGERSGGVVRIPVAKIRADADRNHRGSVPTVDDEALEQSIRTVGLLQPIGVREVAGGDFDLVWGFRRVAALRRLEIAEVDAVRVPPHVDEEAARAIENLSRRDLTPMEQCKAVCQVIANQIRPGETGEESRVIDAAAAILGRSPAWVAQRSYLRRLCPPVVAMVEDGSLPLDYARVIAPLASPERQMEIASRAKRHPDGTGGLPLEHVRYMVAKYTATLDDAPWRLDVPFAGAVACDVCPSNSRNIPRLFDAKEGEEEPAICLDRPCFSKKRSSSTASGRRVIDKVVELTLTAKGDAKPELTVEGLVPHTPSTLRPEPLLAAIKETVKTRKRGGKEPAKPARSRAVPARDLAAERRRRVAAELQQLQYKWAEAAVGELRKVLAKKPKVRAAIVLLGYCALAHKARTKGGIAKVRGASQLIDAAVAGKVPQVAEAVVSGELGWCGQPWQVKDSELFLAVVDKLKVKVPAYPTPEDADASVAAADAKRKEIVGGAE